jgi:hypothetical protein
MHEAPITTPELDALKEWARWKGEGPAPKHWFTTDPAGNTVKVYRSYKDYCDV